MSRPPTIIHIDRVVLRGVDPGQAKAIVEGLRAELTSMFSNSAVRGSMRKSRSAEAIKLGRMPLEAGREGARRFGAAIARAAGKGMRS